VAQVPQEVIIINVMARPGHVFHGAELLNVLQGQGMRLGDMSIFHRHADSQGSGPVMFSMANMVKPGIFDLATMDQFTTPGVSFFLQMPNKLGNMACFDKMLGTASAVRDAFDGELKDENRSVFTRQMVEHCRQRVRDLELKLLSLSRK
jgi:cell division protein ZipA